MSNRSLFGWRSGGWLLVAAVLLVLVAVGWRLASILPAVDDREARAGFDLEPLLVDREYVAETPLGRDGIPSLDHPPVIDVAGVAAVDEAHRGKYLVSADRVLGLVLGGEARAYPLRVLNWHEVVNDTLGGVPIAVTYSPLCDSAVVFDRRVGRATLEWGVSGLLFHSNLVLYDRQEDPATSSLWSQLQARAIAGPAAGRGERLDVLPASIVRWSEWTARHPDTTVLEPHPDRLKRYQRDPYGSYLAKGELRFPVGPLPEVGPAERMRPILVVEREGRFAVHRLDGEETPATPGIELLGGEPPRSVFVDGSADVRTFYTRWFAWAVQNPGGS